GLKGNTAITRGSTDFDEDQCAIPHADAAMTIKTDAANRKRRRNLFGFGGKVGAAGSGKSGAGNSLVSATASSSGRNSSFLTPACENSFVFTPGAYALVSEEAISARSNSSSSSATTGLSLPLKVCVMRRAALTTAVNASPVSARGNSSSCRRTSGKKT